jgi:hypothetical protein
MAHYWHRAEIYSVTDCNPAQSASYRQGGDVNKHPHQDPLTLFSTRLDQGAEVFMHKMFTYLKSRTKESLAGSKGRGKATVPRTRMEKIGQA